MSVPLLMAANSLLRWTTVTVLLLCASSPAAPTLTVDLASPPVGSNITRAHGHGSNNDGLLGVPVCGGFDCDGDGHQDFGFAQFRADPLGRSGAGEVTVLFGDGTIGATTDTSVAQAGVLIIAGEQTDEAAGNEVWMDDVTGDGLGDLLIGRQNHTLAVPSPGPDRAGAGALSILVGNAGWKTHAATLTPLDLGAPPAGLKLLTFVGPGAWDRLGIWMRTGDITGDGIADIVVGADEVDGDGEIVTQNQGTAFVIRGGTHLLSAPAIIDLNDFGQASFPNSLKGHVARIDPPAGADGYHFGATNQICDLDQNGRAEVLIAGTLARAGALVRLPTAPTGTGENFGGAPQGALYIVWDENFPPGPWPENHRFVVTAPPFGDFTAITGGTDSLTFGEEILGGLDYSGDGFPDLLVGDFYASPLGRDHAGRGHVFYNAGNLRGQIFSLDSPPPGVASTVINGPLEDAITADTVLQGDFDGDGIGDLGIGNPHDAPLGRADAGSLHVLYGQAGGWPASIDLLPANLPGPETMRLALIQGANGRPLLSSNAGDTLCYSAASGDLNGDGRPDLIVNEMGGDAFGGSPEDVGNVIVIDAASLLPPFLPTLDLSPTGPIDFGKAQIGLFTFFRTVTITNNSGGPVTITSLALAGPAASAFGITGDTGETVLANTGTRTVTLSFSPTVVGRHGASLTLQTDVDPHPVSVGLAGRGINDFLSDPTCRLHLIGPDAVLEVPQSQFGVDYTFWRSTNLVSPTSLLTLPGNGQTLYFTDPNAVQSFPGAFYQVEGKRN